MNMTMSHRGAQKIRLNQGGEPTDWLTFSFPRALLLWLKSEQKFTGVFLSAYFLPGNKWDFESEVTTSNSGFHETEIEDFGFRLHFVDHKCRTGRP